MFALVSPVTRSSQAARFGFSGSTSGGCAVSVPMQPNSLQCRLQPQRAITLLASGTQNQDVMQSVGLWWNETVEFWDALEIWNPQPIREDTSDEAKALVAQLDMLNATLIQARGERSARQNSGFTRVGEDSDDRVSVLLQPLLGLMGAYYSSKIAKTLNKRAVKRGFSSMLVYANVLFFGIFLRVLLPRLITAGSMDDLFDAASAIGIPDRSTLAAGLAYIQDYDPLLKIAFYILAFVLEKLTMVSEFLPIQIGLKTVAPVIFGGLVEGALASATCETIGASCNYIIGRTFLSERLRSFRLFDSPPLEEAKWFSKLQEASKNNGAQLTLLLRLAPVIPLPFDSYWYLLGALGVSFSDFFAAHFVGCLKTAFLDASFGALLLTAVTVTDDVAQAQLRQVLLAETLGFGIVAILVGTVATKLVNELLGLDEGEDEVVKESNEVSTGTQPLKTVAAASVEKSASATARRID